MKKTGKRIMIKTKKFHSWFIQEMELWFMTEKEYQDYMKRKSDMENMLKEQKLNASKK